MKLIKVDCCLNCPYRYSQINGYRCLYPKKSPARNLGDLTQIPAWCQLDDAPLTGQSSRERLRIGITMRKGSGDTPGDISNAAWLLHVEQKLADVKRNDEEMRKWLGKSHTAKLVEREE